MPREHILRQPLTLEDNSWSFNVTRDLLQAPPPKVNPRTNETTLFGKCVRFTVEKMVLQIQAFPYNRILHTDDPSKFILCSFGDLRFPDTPLRTTGEYIMKMMKEGLWLNGVQYRFYGHSNSQLRSRSCFLREANNDEELDARIYQLGDFGKIMNVAKRAKRIGLLFSEAQLDYQLDPRYVADIADIKSGDELFSDGCGLMSKRLAVQVSKKKKIIFRGVRYTPCVFQIRYLGYKGVLMLHPALDATKPNHLAEFRKSMKKFSTTTNTTFSVVDYSKPYAFGRLNNDIIVLLSSLGITNEKLVQKQQEYHSWIAEASTDPLKAFTFLSSMEEHQVAERVLLDGLDDPAVQRGIKSRQDREVASFKGEKNNKNRSRMIIQKSRLLFGVCDPFGVLKEGQVHIRITTARSGPSTPIHGDVLVVRNPCLHPGDCLKLRAAHYKELSHLTDCIVFASVAKPGRHAAPSMSSGGDLDGDKYFVCWDPDLVPSVVAESYDYPPNKERASRGVSRMDMANHFASYNNAGLARVAALHARWVASSPKGALSVECQELNALHSQAVDGASVKVPEKLSSPPPRPKDAEPFILEALAEHAKAFAEQWTESRALVSGPSSYSTNRTEDMTQDDRERLLLNLLQSEKLTNISEYELFTVAWRFTRKYPGISLKSYLSHFDFGAFTTEQKHAVVGLLELDPRRHPYVWNSLVRSDILGYRDLYQRDLNRPFSLQRLYSSKVDGMVTFFEYLRMATQEYTRKVLILKTDDRFSIAIFMRGEIPWDEDPIVGNNVVVCSFLPQTSDTFSTLRPCTVDYRLRCGDGVFQLYDKVMNNSFVFLVKPPKASGAEVAASIALQKFSRKLQAQLGRLYRQPVVGIEIHVVSNRDRVSHQLFDLWFEHVPTERHVRRFERELTTYTINDMSQVNWDNHPPWTKEIFFPKKTERQVVALVTDKTPDDLDRCMELSLTYHAEDELYWIFTHMVSRQEPLQREWITYWMDAHPPLAFVLLKVHPPDEETKTLPPVTRPFRRNILQNIIRSGNHLTVASLVALEKLAGSIAEIPVEEYIDLLWLTAQSVRAPELVQETLLVLNDCRNTSHHHHPPALRYGHIHALGIAVDRAEEAKDECPCDESGRPRKKQKSPPVQAKLERGGDPDKPLQVKVMIRVDSRPSVRLHSHVRLQAASKPEKGWVAPIVLDGVVVMALKGEMKIELVHPPPPEIDTLPSTVAEPGQEEEVSTPTTSRAMLDALTRLMKDKSGCCGFYDIITGGHRNSEATAAPTDFPPILEEGEHIEGLNPSQEAAIRSCRGPLSLIWGPPGESSSPSSGSISFHITGTGKTTVIVQILRGLVRTKDEDARILMTASTHNGMP
ncbi:RNA-directed RNA polymerase [Marasmius fiardii PR-910]|nr:RNA-directed RNA polymerase [Marasmius fiardii PR-910]